MDVDANKLADEKIPTGKRLGFAFNMVVFQNTPQQFGYSTTSNNIFYFDEKRNSVLELTRKNLLQIYKGQDKNLSRKIDYQLSMELREGVISPVAVSLVKNLFNPIMTSKDKYPILEFRKLVMPGLDKTGYAVINKILTSITGPVTFADSIEEYLRRNIHVTLEIFHSLTIKMPFQNDRDLSWITDRNQKIKLFQLKRATRIIGLAYLKYKEKLKHNKLSKVLIYDITAHKKTILSNELKIVSRFEEINVNDIPEVEFQPTLAPKHLS